MFWIKRTVLLITIIFLCVPLVLKIFKPITPRPLYGYYEPLKRPVISFGNIISKNFQDMVGPFSERTIPLRPVFVRLYNQIDFSFFGVPHAQQLVVGKHNYLFEEPYIKAYLGRDFFGKEKIDARVWQFKELQERLWKEKNILMLVIFAPDKGSFYPEYIPDRFLKSGKDTTNYQWYKQGLEKTGVNFIDFNQWYLEIKDTSGFILYPKTGIHWSSYGAYLAMDSLIHYLNNKLEITLPEPVLDKLEFTNIAREKDDDMNQALNLIWNIPHPALAYPHFYYRKTNTEKKLSALFIGDSFYFCWSKPGYIKNIFSNEEFWYYDHNVYIDGIKQKNIVSDLDLGQSIDRQNVIIFIQTNAGYGNAGYGFVDRALKLLTEKSNTGK